ncbi:type II secretion system protein E, partial [mine drainage metagenome]
IQISEVAGKESQVLLSDLYKYDYRNMGQSPMLPSVTYRDQLSKLLGIPPPDILAEENLRAEILMQLNSMGKTSMSDISEAVRNYYINPNELLSSIGIHGQPVVFI